MSDEELVLESRSMVLLAPASRPAADVDVDAQLEQDLLRIPVKMAFKIGEVADLLNVKPYVLRYWETEFEQLKPKKSKRNQRMYERRDVETLMLIKKLLYRDRFSIEGARSALRKLRKESRTVKSMATLTESCEQAALSLEELIDYIGKIRERYRA
jgi:DNA-binding transcriptional MerR regulator